MPADSPRCRRREPFRAEAALVRDFGRQRHAAPGGDRPRGVGYRDGWSFVLGEHGQIAPGLRFDLPLGLEPSDRLFGLPVGRERPGHLALDAEVLWHRQGEHAAVVPRIEIRGLPAVRAARLDRVLGANRDVRLLHEIPIEVPEMQLIAAVRILGPAVEIGCTDCPELKVISVPDKKPPGCAMAPRAADQHQYGCNTRQPASAPTSVLSSPTGSARSAAATSAAPCGRPTVFRTLPG